MKYQLTCPKCKHEFAYDNGSIDRSIARLRAELSEINVKLERFRKMNSRIRASKKDLRDDLQIRKAEIIHELTNLKSLRKVSDQQVNNYMYNVFKALVKERFGDIVYKELLEEAKKECESYTVSTMMHHEYSRKKGNNIVGINKV